MIWSNLLTVSIFWTDENIVHSHYAWSDVFETIIHYGCLRWDSQSQFVYIMSFNHFPSKMQHWKILKISPIWTKNENCICLKTSWPIRMNLLPYCVWILIWIMLKVQISVLMNFAVPIDLYTSSKICLMSALQK